MKINWGEILTEFDNWLSDFGRESCPTCNKLIKDYPDWVEQQKKIQQLVNKQLKRLISSCSCIIG
jgi:hypothetical protein